MKGLGPPHRKENNKIVKKVEEMLNVLRHGCHDPLTRTFCIQLQIILKSEFLKYFQQSTAYNCTQL